MSGPAAKSHIVQLFDNPATLAETVAVYIAEGIAEGKVVLVVAADDHWDLVAQRLASRNPSIPQAIAAGRLVVRDAVELLEVLSNHGAIRRDRFDAIVGSLVRGLGSDGSRLRIYGEMVDALLDVGDMVNALRLEALWNELAAKVPFELLCGYSSVHFGNPARAGALRDICQQHAQLRSNPSDLLGDYLLRAAARES